MEKRKGFILFFNGDIIFLLICLGFSLLMIYQTKELHDESATLVPRLFGILGILFALNAILIRAITFYKKFKEEFVSFKEIKGEEAMSLYLAVALSIIYLILTELLGFILASILIIFVFLWFAKYRRIFLGLIYSIVTSLAIYFLFYNILKVNLPHGRIF